MVNVKTQQKGLLNQTPPQARLEPKGGCSRGCCPDPQTTLPKRYMPLAQLSTPCSRGMGAATSLLPGDQGTVEATALWCCVLGRLIQSLEGERPGVVSGADAHGSPGSDFQPKEFCVQRISFAFRDKNNLCPQTPCLFRLAMVRWGSYGSPGILSQVRFPQPPLGRPKPRVSWEDPGQGLVLAPSPGPARLQASLLTTAVHQSAEMHSGAAPGALPCRSCLAGWHQARESACGSPSAGSDDQPLLEAHLSERISELLLPCAPQGKCKWSTLNPG